LPTGHGRGLRTLLVLSPPPCMGESMGGLLAGNESFLNRHCDAAQSACSGSCATNPLPCTHHSTPALPEGFVHLSTADVTDSSAVDAHIVWNPDTTYIQSRLSE
jgi:hypothetical protein